MGIFTVIMENPIYRALMVCGVLIASELVLWKKQMHYNRSGDGKMNNHLLNRKYHLNEKKKIDLEYINKTIALWNIGGIALSGIAMYFDLIIGVFAYLILIIAANYYVSAKIAKKYENSK